MTEVIIKPLAWIVGGKSSVAYAEAFRQPGFYTIRGTEGDWKLEYPDNGYLNIDEGHETQIAARRAAQEHFERTAKAAIDFVAKETDLRALLSRAEEYVIDGITEAKSQVEMNEPYPTRLPRYLDRLAEARQLHADITEALKGAKA